MPLDYLSLSLSASLIRYTAEQLCTLKGHSGAVRSISWREGDRGLASTGVDGAVYEWEWGPDVPIMERLQSSDYVIKVAKNEAVKCGARVKGVTTLYVTARDGAPSASVPPLTASDCLPRQFHGRPRRRAQVPGGRLAALREAHRFGQADGARHFQIG